MASIIPKRLLIDPRRALPDEVWPEVHTALEHGELIILPTETVYGLGADPRQPNAVQRLYEAKRRPGEKAIARLAADADQVRADGAQWNARAAVLADRFWPGPLTLVLDAPQGTMGYRVPDLPVTQSLLARFGRVLAVTSANPSGEPPARSAAEALRTMGRSAALVLDAGPSPGGIPSTVVSVAGDQVKLLREGAIMRGEIQSALGKSGELE